MSKTLTLTLALVAATSISALAADTASTQDAFTAQLSVNANAEQVRKLLLAKNYKNVSHLGRDEGGRWTGTAVKNGKTTFVSVYLPAKPTVPQTN